MELHNNPAASWRFVTVQVCRRCRYAAHASRKSHHLRAVHMQSVGMDIHSKFDVATVLKPSHCAVRMITPVDSARSLVGGSRIQGRAWSMDGRP
jgi:hypothetical protein